MQRPFFNGREKDMKKNYLVVRTRSAVTRLEREEIVYVLKDERRLIVVTQEKDYVYNATM